MRKVQMLRGRASVLVMAVVFLVMCTISVSLGFQVTGKGSITGVVTDSKTKEGLPGVNIVVKGTYFGAVTDIDGKFLIKDVTPGTYTVEVSLIGYKKIQYGALTVNPGEPSKIDAKLEETVLSLGQEVVILGEKPLFNIEETQSTHTMNTGEVKAAAVRTVQDIAALQTGVVQADGEIHIRGGRTYENAYLVDGISVQDPLSGTGFGLQVSPSSIQDVDVITGGYNAEYGQATSGIVNITTKEGSKEYRGSLALTRDHLGSNDNSRLSEHTDVYDASLSGPEPITHFLLPSLGVQIPGDVSFFGSVYANLSDGYQRYVENIVNGQPNGYVQRPVPNLVSSLFPNSSWLAPRADNSWSWHSKLTWKPSSVVKLTYGNSGSININQDTKSVQATLEHVDPNPGFQYEFLNIPDSANTFTQYNMQQSLGLTQTLSNKAFYELRFSRFVAHVRADANGKIDTLYVQPQDIITFPIQYYNETRDTIGVIPGDGFYDVGNASRWRDQSTIEYTIKGDLTNNFSETHKFKTGFEARFQDLQMIDILQPWYNKPAGLNNDFYHVYPALGAFYAQENITLKGMILNVGLRLDYWFPGKYVDDAVGLPASKTNIPDNVRSAYMNDTYGLFGSRMKARLSPRLGISHPVSDKQSMFFSYGHFSKFPRPEFVYSKLIQSAARTAYPIIGNPDLNPETTVSYELGVRNQLSGNDVLTITAYYKDIFDYITAHQLQAQGSRFSTYTTYVNLDYSRIRGIEAEYKSRLSGWFQAVFSGSYSVATGKSSTSDEAIYNLSQGLTETITEQPAVFDRPLQLTATLNFNSSKEGYENGVLNALLKNSDSYVRIFYESGKRYTPQLFYGVDPSNGRPYYSPDYDHPYSEIGDPWFYVNCNFAKHFDLPFGKMTLSLEIRNLLDRKNSQILNPVTGRAYEYGDATAYPGTVNDPKYPDLTYPVTAFPYNPARYLNPRTVRMGLEWSF